MDWIGSVGSQEEIDKVCRFLNEMTGEMKKNQITLRMYHPIYPVIPHVKP